MVTATAIKKGYKQTELGVIPEDWDVKKLGDLGVSIIGLTYSPTDVSDSGKLVHRSSNIQNNQLSYEDNVYVSKPVDQKLVLRENDILICVRNGSRDLIGKSALIKGKAVGETFGAFMAVFRSDGCQPYLFHLILSNLVQRQISESMGATINQITNKTLNSFQIPYPTKTEEQEAIAAVLSDTDALIERLKKLIAKKKTIKQGAIQQLLTGIKRLPGFVCKRGYKQTEVGAIPEDWDIKELGELGIFSKGQGIKKDQSQSGELPCVRYGELYTRHNDYVKRFYSCISKEVALTSKKLAFGDILFAGSGETKEEIGKCAAFIYRIEAYAGGDIVVFSPHGADSLFLGYLLNSPTIVKQKANKGQGDAVVHISAVSLKEIKVPLPRKEEEQRAIAAILYDMDAEIEALEQKHYKYSLLKRGMMQQLLMGKVRIYANK